MDTLRRLTLLRHGKAAEAETGGADFERTLTPRGVRQAEEMAHKLVARRWVPDLIVASPAERAWATASIVARIASLPAGRLQTEPALYQAAPGTIWRIATDRGRAALHVLVCGHNPGLSELASRFGPRPQERRLSTAGLASAVWSAPDWIALLPADALACDTDGPEKASAGS